MNVLLATKQDFVVHYFGALAAMFILTSVRADPVIEVVEGEVGNGVEMVIRGTGFTEKANPQPLFWWTADGGDGPSALGRLADWSGGFDGDDEVSSTRVAPGSSRSYRFDHGSSGSAALGTVDFESDRAYMWRKKFDDFDITKDFAIRTRWKDGSGQFSIGQTVTGETSGTTGVIAMAYDKGDGTGTIFYDPAKGTVAAGENFLSGEKITTETGSGIDDEGVGTLRSFNFKTTRWYSPDQNNISVSAQYHNRQYAITPALPGSDQPGSLRIHSDLLAQYPETWNVEQIVYQTSDLGVANGIFWFSVNNRFVYEDRVIMRDAVKPGRYNKIYQSQVSNGAQPGSWVYYDSLYIDDSWHRVLMSSASTWAASRDVEVQIPLAWYPDEIRIQMRLGSLNAGDGIYLYVVDSEGRVNATGYKLECEKCPVRPDPFTVN